ncbi:MAG TPA: glycosyltransferase family A protein [Chryseolinea sp.]|nr:glycosyltransferase family A protein [Chryseolinea sp.]HPM30893.1 glycosyltransferase family A protein [Chryseolinea sp.]
MGEPLVTIICLCYNHAVFIREAVESVIHQSYKNTQIILIDDASKDESVQEIDKLKNQYPFLETVLLPVNVGNCKAFNAAFKLAKGEYIIDFATDDVMMPDRIEKQVHFFEHLDHSYGVVFTDAVYMDVNGFVFRNHFEYLFSKGLLTSIPQGDVYQAVLRQYFIASPTMMIRRNVLDELGGYDENLSYEDFDFWVRSSRNYKYALLNEKLTKIRRKHKSLSSGWYKPGDQQLHSTYVVCKKAQEINRSEGDTLALAKRARYELRQSFFSENHVEAKLFFQLLNDLQQLRGLDLAIVNLSKLHLPMSSFRMWYHQLRYSD